MSAPTRGLSWQPEPVPGTTDRYTVHQTGQERGYSPADYGLELSYDQAATVARLLDEATDPTALELADEERDAALDQRDEAMAVADGLRQEIESLKEELAEARARLSEH